MKEIECWWKREREGWSHRVWNGVCALLLATAEEDAVMEELFGSRAK